VDTVIVARTFILEDHSPEEDDDDDDGRMYLGCPALETQVAGLKACRRVLARLQKDWRAEESLAP
jgi:hypothetical protein